MPFESFFENLPLINSVGMRTGVTLTCGSTAGSKPITVATTYIQNQTYLLVTGPATGTSGAGYFKIMTAGELTGQIATLMVRTNVYHNVFDAYGLQSHLTFNTSTSIATTDANAHLTAISGKVTFDTSTISKGWVTAGLFIIEGAGTCSQMCHGVSIVQEAGSTGCQSLLHLNSDVAICRAFSFAGTSGASNMIYEATDTTVTHSGSIKIYVNGADRYLHYSSSAAANS